MGCLSEGYGHQQSVSVQTLISCGSLGVSAFALRRRKVGGWVLSISVRECGIWMGGGGSDEIGEGRV